MRSILISTLAFPFLHLHSKTSSVNMLGALHIVSMSCFFMVFNFLMCYVLLTNILFEQDDQEGVRTVDDDNFIDDTGVDPADRYGSDNERHSPSRYAQVLVLNCSDALRTLCSCCIFKITDLQFESKVCCPSLLGFVVYHYQRLLWLYDLVYCWQILLYDAKDPFHVII
jgi:hypothetical protein